MTKTEITEQELSDMGIRIIHCPCLQRKAIAGEEGFVVVGEIADSREARTVLEHEKQHFRLSAFYTQYADSTMRRRGEARVNRALIRELCPKKTLCALLRQGRTVAEIAETLEVTEELVVDAYAFYSEQDPRAFRRRRCE
jgi:hypothetical protein